MSRIFTFKSKWQNLIFLNRIFLKLPSLLRCFFNYCFETIPCTCVLLDVTM